MISTAFPLLGLAAIGALLAPVGVGASDVFGSTRRFGTVSYRETISTRSADELPIIGMRDKSTVLSLDVPVPLGSVTINDSETSLTIGLGNKRCFVVRSVDGYRDASVARIARILPSWTGSCGWSDAAIANTVVVLESKAGEIRAALAHMRQRAIVLLGSDLRCNPRLERPRPGDPIIILQNLDGGPRSGPCMDASD